MRGPLGAPVQQCTGATRRVVGGVPAGFVPGELGGLLVVGGGLPGGGSGRQGREFWQCPGCLGAVQVAVGDDCSVMGALGAAVVGVQTSDAFSCQAAALRVVWSGAGKAAVSS
jgi:hypothetical protein